MAFDFRCPSCRECIDQLLEEQHDHTLEEVIIKCPKCKEALVPCDICNSFFSLRLDVEEDDLLDIDDTVENMFCENCCWLHLVHPVTLREYFDFSPKIHRIPFTLVQYIQRQIDQRLYMRDKKREFGLLNVALSSPVHGNNETIPPDDLESKRHKFMYLRKQLDIINNLPLQMNIEHSFSFIRFFNSFTDSHFRMLQSLYNGEKGTIPFQLIKEFLSEKKSLANLKKKYHLHRLARKGLDDIENEHIRKDLELKTIFTSQCITRKEEWTKRTEKYKRLLSLLSTKVVADIVNEMNKQHNNSVGVGEIGKEGRTSFDDDENEEEEEEIDDNFFLFGEEDNGSEIKKISLLNKYNLIKRLYGCVTCVIF